MHRDLSITVPPGATEPLLRELNSLDGVITMSLRRGDSVKPPGDVIEATVLNAEVDLVMAAVARSEVHGPVSVRSSSVDSLIDSMQQRRVRRDVDEATWEEAETAMRRHTRLTSNFVLTTATAGMIVTTSLITSDHVTGAVAVVAGGIIAPSFEPLVRVALAVITRRARWLPPALGVALLGYIVLAAMGFLTMLLLRAGGHHFVADFIHNRTEHEVQHPPAINLMISAAGAIAGAVMVAAGRFTQLAGPLVALQILPACAAAGVALELSKGRTFVRCLDRVGIDIAMVLVACLGVFAFKHLLVHRRRLPLR